MKKGRCLKCNSENVVASRDKVGVGFDKAIYILLGTGWHPTKKLTTYLCLDCGYFENYVTDREMLDKVQSDPEKMGWGRVK